MLFTQFSNNRLPCMVGMVMAASLAPGACLAGEPTGPSVADKKLIKWGWDVPSTELVRRNIRRMEQTGYDGIGIRFLIPPEQAGSESFEVDAWWISSRKLQPDRFAQAIEDLKATKFERFTDNFIFMYGNAAGGPAFWFEEDHAAVFMQNMCLAAKICKETGLKGFLIDTEGYGSWTQMNSDYPLNTLKMTIEEARARVRQVTSQAARLVSDIYPDITILIIYTGFSDHDQVPTNRSRLTSGFTDGWLEGLGPRARIFDMREQAYGCKTHAEFQEIAASAANEFMNSQIPDLHKNRLNLGFGVWLDNRGRPGELGGWFQDPQMNHSTPSELSNLLYYGLINSDEYVWVYSERAYSWPGAQNCKSWDEVNVPQAYFDAIADAKRPRPLNNPLDPRGADVEKLPPPAATVAGYERMFGRPSPVAVFLQGREVADYNKDLTDPLEQAKYRFVMDIDKGWQVWFDSSNRGLGTRTAVLKKHQQEYPDLPKPAWQPIRVGEFWEQQSHKYNGAAWYRSSFVIPDSLTGKEVWLVFGAVADYCRIFVNERGNLYWRPHNVPQPLADQAGPRMNITEFVDFGKENEIVVWVYNIRGPGGIWKPVKLAVSR